MHIYTHHTTTTNHVLHGLSALIVAFFFRSRWLLLLCNMRRLFSIIVKLIALTGIADILTACFYYLFHLYPIALPLPCGLAITSLLLYSLRWCTPKNSHKNNKLHKLHNRSFDLTAALLLGCVQGLALLPGISRFASVYVASRWLGFNAQKGLQITWMIFWPLLIAASAHGVYQLAHAHIITSLITGPVLLVLTIATIGGYGAFCFAAHLAYTDKFWQFSWYVAFIAFITLWIS